MATNQLSLFAQAPVTPCFDGASLYDHLMRFDEFGTVSSTYSTDVEGPGGASYAVPTVVNEFWTSKQRAAHSLHEISYRACFKPQLPRFFIDRLTEPGDAVYDPFMGRGTTVLESALMGRVPVGCDINPLSVALVAPRLRPVTEADVASRLGALDLETAADCPEDLLVFYHPDTLRQICALRQYFVAREESADLDATDAWIRMVAINRLTGHSRGFFSVYTLPPNQAVSVDSQRKINAKRDQTPPPRDVKATILRKTRSLLRRYGAEDRSALAAVGSEARLLTRLAGHTPEIEDGSIRLVVTSPPFLDIVNYAQDNWLRCWFCGIDADGVEIGMHRRVDEWQAAMTEVFHELARTLSPGGHVAFEVGEVRNGKIRLEEAVIPCGVRAGLNPTLIVINDQEFTKTANCWGVDNSTKGTNTNRIVVFTKG